MTPEESEFIGESTKAKLKAFSVPFHLMLRHGFEEDSVTENEAEDISSMTPEELVALKNKALFASSQSMLSGDLPESEPGEDKPDIVPPNIKSMLSHPEMAEDFREFVAMFKQTINEFFGPDTQK